MQKEGKMSEIDVQRFENAVYVFAMTTQALLQMEGMKAENMRREHQGEAMAYTEADFNAVVMGHGVHHNAVMKRFSDGI